MVWFFFSLKEKFCGIYFSDFAGMNLCQMQNACKSRIAFWIKLVLINHHGHKEVSQCVKLSEPLQNLGRQHV